MWRGVSKDLRGFAFRSFVRCHGKVPQPKVISGVNQVIAVSSNKGGVGKSTTAGKVFVALRICLICDRV